MATGAAAPTHLLCDWGASRGLCPLPAWLTGVGSGQHWPRELPDARPGHRPGLRGQRSCRALCAGGAGSASPRAALQCPPVPC